MTSIPIVPRFTHLKQGAYHRLLARNGHHTQAVRPNLRRLARDETSLPRFVQDSAVAMRYLRLLAPLDWDHFPERDLQRNYGQPALPYMPFVAACLVKLDQRLTYMHQLRQYLVEHPALTWVLGFPLIPSRQFPWGFDVEASLPTHRHFTRMLRQLPNPALQYLLDSTVAGLGAALPVDLAFGQCVSLDTKHILAWVKENNPKAYLKRSQRFDKNQQPKGDPDCRLGCKRRHNQRASAADPPPTPAADPFPANTLSIGEFYWGYASGVVATKLPGWGEFVLAELTQPFDRPDVSYFYPLMAAVERRLGFRPRYAALDAAFDAFYIYAYFHRPDQPDTLSAFAAVPLSKRGGHAKTFDPHGLPLCQAGLPMPLKYTFISKSTLFEHPRGRYVCPLLFPQPTGQACPRAHKNWPKGCITTMPTSIGARIRYQLDRQSELYKQVYKQRTATERVNSQAVELGIERPKLRNGQAIANQNTLIYVLINLRALERVHQKQAHLPTAAPLSRSST
jgi:hypothetical protein